MSTPAPLLALQPGYRRVASRKMLTRAGGASFEAWTGGREVANMSTVDAHPELTHLGV